jgi:predicted ATPase/DNA-binding SARP family transcriptional activator
MDDEPLSGLPSQAAVALLVYLACHPGDHARDQLAEMLWADRPAAQSLANLRSILSSLRKAVGDVLLVSRQTVGLDPDGNIALDRDQFLTALGPVSITTGNIQPEDAAGIELALELYRGEFMAGFSLADGRRFDEWLLLEREAHRQAAQSGLVRLIQYSREQADFGRGLHWAEQLVRLDPYDEAARRDMMELAMRAGQRTLGLRGYHELEQLLAEDLEVAPSRTTQALFERFQSLPSPPPIELPSSGTPFIGREDEIQAITTELGRADNRLITLRGPGGIGKTRLALEIGSRIAAQGAGRFLNGLYFVTLAAVDEPDLFAVNMAERLRFTPDGAKALDEELLDYLREKEVLLILDNLEQLQAAGPQTAQFIAAILAAAPQVKILATSRESLNLQDEFTFDLEGLRGPAAGETDPETFGAVALFLAAARRAQPRFNPQGAELEQIVQICRRLEGIPLAIELASSWIRQYRPSEILTQLDGSLDFLATRSRAVPERHRSLRAVFEHSWSLLSAAEQDALVRLSIFPASFFAESAALVGEAAPAHLAALADKSLINRDGSRYRLNPLLREFSFDRLKADAKTLLAAQASHSAHFNQFAAERHADYQRGDQTGSLNAIELELANVRLAMHDLIDRHLLASVPQGWEGMATFFWVRNRLQEGRSLVQAGLYSLAEPGSPVLRGRLLTWQAEFSMAMAEFEPAAADLAAARDLLQDAGDALAFGRTLECSGRLAYFSADYDDAVRWFEASLAQVDQVDSPSDRAQALTALGNVYADGYADYQQGNAYLDEALAISRAQGDRNGIAKVLINQGSNALVQGSLDEARRLFEESLAAYRELDYGYGVWAALKNLGQIELALSHNDAAESWIREALSLNRDSGNRLATLRTLTLLARVLAGQQSFRAAHNQMLEALELAEALQSEHLVVEVLISVGRVMVEAGDLPAGLALTHFAIQHGETSRETLLGGESWLAFVEPTLDPSEVASARATGQSLTMAEAREHVRAWRAPGIKTG